MLSHLILVIHLNTSHVKVNPPNIEGDIPQDDNLNTSHVKVNQYLYSSWSVMFIYLNTSHVKVNPLKK